MAHSFGPLNQDGGERRLNVLITRARYSCEVFANFDADDIDLARSNAGGVRALKKFLAYAKTGIMEIGIATGGDSESPFEEDVEAELVRLSWHIERQIGVGGFRIDLAVKDSERPGRYLLGIECDGATYHSARWARDRDRLRQQVLEGLGWRIHRVWSTDWYQDKAREVRRLVESFERAKAHFEALARGEGTRVPISRPQSTEVLRESINRAESALATTTPYKIAALDINLGGMQLHEIPISAAARLCTKVVEVEGPIHIDLVFRRVVEGAGIQRVGSRIRDRLLSGVNDAVRKGALLKDGVFLSTPGHKLDAPRDRSDFEGPFRNFDWVPDEEIRLALMEVIKAAFSISEEEAFKGALTRLGLKRLTADGKGRIASELDVLINNGSVERMGDLLQLKQ